MSSAHPPLHLPARDIPVPTSVSPEAQAIIALGPLGPAPVWPDSDDPAEWATVVEEYRAGANALIGDRGPLPGVHVEERIIDGVRVFVDTPDDVDPHDRRVFFDVHGGAFILDDPMRGTVNAKMMRARTWSVDYRMPPAHPYPAPLDDCMTAYRALLGEREPHEIIAGGSSAGGNLVAAMVLRARDEGLPLPAAMVLMSGGFDLTGSGDTLMTNLGLDNVLTGNITPVGGLYGGGHDLRDPYLSPLFGDFTKGFPPSIILSGTRDLFLSDNVRMHRALRRAGLPSELHVFEAAAHGRYLGAAPEERDYENEVRRFVDEHWAKGLA